MFLERYKSPVLSTIALTHEGSSLRFSQLEALKSQFRSNKKGLRCLQHLLKTNKARYFPNLAALNSLDEQAGDQSS